MRNSSLESKVLSRVLKNRKNLNLNLFLHLKMTIKYSKLLMQLQLKKALLKQNRLPDDQISEGQLLYIPFINK